jgi:hypothetical protein
MTRSVLLIICLAAGPAWAAGELSPADAQDEQSATPEAAPVVEISGEQNAMPEAAPVVEASETQGAPPEAVPVGEVARASFTSQIVEREPVDSIERLSADQPQILFFTELSGLAGQTVTHRWEHGGEVMAEVPFEVGADRWRVYSSKRLLPGWVGEWSVAVLDSQGRVLSTRSFEYLAPLPASPQDETPEDEAP